MQLYCEVPMLSYGMTPGMLRRGVMFTHSNIHANHKKRYVTTTTRAQERVKSN